MCGQVQAISTPARTHAVDLPALCLSVQMAAAWAGGAAAGHSCACSLVARDTHMLHFDSKHVLDGCAAIHWQPLPAID
jgi:hypothetical protein